MKYVVITTKHHEGFCLWDSALTDYKATNTPCGKDLLHPMVDAFRAEGLQGRLLPLADRLAPSRVHRRPHPPDARRPGIPRSHKDRDIRKYAAYLHGQTRELLTQFGKIDVLWFDFSYAGRPFPGARARAGTTGSPRSWSSWCASSSPASSSTTGWTCPAGDVKTPEEYQPRGWMTVDGKPRRLGGVPDLQRKLGLLPGQHGLASPDS